MVRPLSIRPNRLFCIYTARKISFGISLPQFIQVSNRYKECVNVVSHGTAQCSTDVKKTSSETTPDAKLDPAPRTVSLATTESCNGIIIHIFVLRQHVNVFYTLPLRELPCLSCSSLQKCVTCVFNPTCLSILLLLVVVRLATTGRTQRESTLTTNPPQPST